MGKDNFVVTVFGEHVDDIKVFGPFDREKADDVVYELESHESDGDYYVSVTRLVGEYVPRGDG